MACTVVALPGNTKAKKQIDRKDNFNNVSVRLSRVHYGNEVRIILPFNEGELGRFLIFFERSFFFCFIVLSMVTGDGYGRLYHAKSRRRQFEKRLAPFP